MERCKNYHLSAPHWFGCVLLCYVALWIPREMLLKWLCIWWSQATAWCVLRDLLGFMHNALCVSWEGWTSDREDWVSSRIPNGLLLLSLSSCPALPPPLPLFYAIRWKQPTSLMWPFPVCGTRTKKLHFLSMLLQSFSLTLPLFILLSLSLQSVLLPFFYLSVLMIYFCKNVWPVL